MTAPTHISIRTAAQVFEELSNTNEKKESEKFVRLYNEWQELLKEESAVKLCPHCQQPLIEGACPAIWNMREAIRIK